MDLKRREKLLSFQNVNFITTYNYLSLEHFFVMPKSDIHPNWFPEAKVICNGEVVMTTGSTQEEIHVDVWSGNHPFFTGTQKILDTEGRVDRFMRKYGMASTNNENNSEKDKPSNKTNNSSETKES